MSALQGCESGWDRRLSDGFRNRSTDFGAAVRVSSTR